MDSLVEIGKERKMPARSSARAGVYIKTFGCQMNAYDTEKLYRILSDRYDPVDTPEEANLIVINTCSVRDKPEQKLYSLLGKLRPLKDSGVVIGVGGCVAQQEGENIIRRAKYVDFVFGTHNLSLVPSLIARSTVEGLGPQVAVDYRDEWEDLPLGISQGGRASVFVSISRGCNKNCTYCIVPTTRGAEVSRPREEILREVRLAQHRGAREVVLLGQTVNSYGRDFSKRYGFTHLIADIAGVDGIERIRFMSPHPQEIRKDFLDLVSSEPKLCRHIHMPLQSGSDRILKAMNRNYRRARYLRIVQGLQQRLPDMAITTDIIVGFPGETRKDFEATLEVVRELQFDGSYSFVFSPRPGTVAKDLDDPVSAEEKLDRLYELQALQNEITTRRLADWVGKRAQVLIDGPSKGRSGQVQGRTSQNFTVNLDDENGDLGAGMLTDVVIAGVSRYTLRGKRSVEEST